MSDEKTDYTALAGVLDRLEASRLNDGPVLERIERHTSVLPRLFSSLDFSLKRSVQQAKSIKESPRPVTPKVERTAPAVAKKAVDAPSVPVAMADATVVKPSPATVTPDAPPVTPATNTEKPKTATVNATRTPAPIAEFRHRDQQGRFKSQAAMAEARQETQDKSIRQVIQDAVKPSRSGFFSRRADEGTVENAAGKAAGGPFWEAGKELAEAAGEIREKIHDDKTITGRTWKAIGRRFGLKGKDQTTLAIEKGEKAEQKRHRELLQAVENSRGGGGEGGGTLDAIDDALDIFGNLKRVKKSPLSKIPGGGAKGAGIGGLLLNPAMLLGGLAAFSVGSALKSLIFGGSNPINELFNRTGLGVDPSPPPVASKNFQKNYSQYAPAVKAAAEKYGVSEDNMRTMMLIESGGDTNARSSTGAEGLYQFTQGTGRAYGIEGRRRDPMANIDAAARLTRDNMAAMRRSGIAVNDSNVYMAHQLGVGRIGGGGLKDLLNAQKTGQVSPALRKQMDLNGGKGMTAAQFVQMWRKKYYDKAQEAGARGNSIREQPSPTEAHPTVATADAKKETQRKGSKKRTTARGGRKQAEKEPTVVASSLAPEPVPAVPRPVKQIEAPPPEPAAPAPAPQVAGMDQLLAAVERLADAQKPKGKGEETPQIIKTEFDDTTLVLMCYDRI